MHGKWLLGQIALRARQMKPQQHAAAFAKAAGDPTNMMLLKQGLVFSVHSVIVLLMVVKVAIAVRFRGPPLLCTC